MMDDATSLLESRLDAIRDCGNRLKDIFETIAGACRRLDATIVLDEKLVPLEGEDETRVV